MKYIHTLFDAKKPIISFELFPPRTEKGVALLEKKIQELIKLSPDFISVTCHNHQNMPKYTQHICEYIQEYNVPAVAHFTAVGQSKENLTEELLQLKKANICNILALRGDTIEGTPIGFSSSVALLEHIGHQTQASMAAACYVMPHPESLGRTSDIAYIKRKIEAGAKVLITQLFFENTAFYEFYNDVRSAGITIPICAGIMPVTNKRQIERVCDISGVEIPEKYRRILERYEHAPEKLFEAGIAYATEQIIDLVSFGVEGIHLYSLNNIEITKRIVQNISVICSE